MAQNLRSSRLIQNSPLPPSPLFFCVVLVWVPSASAGARPGGAYAAACFHVRPFLDARVRGGWPHAAGMSHVGAWDAHKVLTIPLPP